MAHMEDQMRPPDLEPGSIGSYQITHACFINDEQIFHMKLWGLNFSLIPHGAWGIPLIHNGIPFDVSAVVCNPLGHAVHHTGTYRILEFDFRSRHCILDLGSTIGRHMNMKWCVDRLASERVYKWHAWP